MQSTSLHARVLASLSLVAAAVAQDGTTKPAAVAAPGKPAAVAAPGKQAQAAAPDLTTGLPAFLLQVPAGKVEMGLAAEELVEVASEVVRPENPKDAIKFSAEKLTTAMRRSAFVLGRRTVDVDAFLLGKHPVTNAQYEVYVKLMRAAGIKQRPPFAWWRWGNEKDYNDKLPEIAREFPKDPDGPVLYWERHGGEFDYKVLGERGADIRNLPVSHVSWRDANAFAGFYGMRLPTEAELTRAMRGDGKNLWPGNDGSDKAKDVFTPKLFELLQMNNSKNRLLKPIGAVQAAIGPFGHADLFGQIWQFAAARGFYPINGDEPFRDEWKQLQKDKVGSLVKAPPIADPEKVIAKGGSFLSWQEPIQLLIDARAPVQPYEVLEGLGFRLAKSLKPGYDMLFSLLRGGYNRDLFGESQDLDLSAQSGAERYEFGADGFPTAYQAVSFAPVNWLVKEKTVDTSKLIDGCQDRPLLIGALATSTPLAEPALPQGLYVVLYRRAGVPKELTDAVKQGYKEVKANLKQKEKGGEAPAEEAPQDENGKKKPWRQVIGRFGLTEKDLEDKRFADGKVEFVRYDGLELTTDKDCFVLVRDGKAGGVIVGGENKPASAGAPFPTELVVESNTKSKGKEGKLMASFRVAVPVLMVNNKKWLDFRLHVTLDQPAPAADKPWRLPQ
ncbi:MAG: SUMF1/EgtB/PvdO family nonheme iron enzyme [Planctomycetes bacterium]|nr:SUMF1/EgtB/PvdO family nonheme iron enzyme [Planctomycetota bacterium]